ncbi:MAG: YbhB/YbcL family Raf kinase inhibitor-like protein, partial [Leuconostoc falkenbergense]
MKLNVTLENQLLPDIYAKYAPDNYRTNGMPTVN